MTPGTDTTQEWYVIFTTSKLDHWIFRWLNPCFQHCYMVREDQGLWVVVDSRSSNTEIRTELVDDYPHIRILCPNSVIIPVSVKINPKRYKWNLGINSCVDVCKGIMGIDNWRIFTPYKLYRWLNG